jgi:signal transduction histidine kinase
MKLPERILQRFTAISLAAKILGMVAGVVLILGFVVTLQEGRALIVRDICAECTRISPALVNSEGLVTHASVPLMAGDRTLGVMNVASSSVREYTPDDMTLLNAVGRQLGIAVENARLWEEVKEKETLRQQFLEKVIAAQEAERQRLARELHDEAAQTLTALSLGLRRLQDDQNLPLPQRKLAEDLKSQTTGLASELHRLSVELRPSALDRVGLVGALEQYIQEFKRRYTLEAQFESDNLDQTSLSPEIETNLYRIIQEALTNVARHAQARSVSVLLQVRDGQIVTTIEDDGKGFDLAQAQKNGRLGLFGMQERAAMLGGSLNIEAAPGQGTTVFVKIPLSLL